MSALLRVGLWVERVQAGIARMIGRADVPYQHSDGSLAEFTTTGGADGPSRRGIVCATGDETVIWDFTDDPIDFELAVINSDQMGYLVVYVDNETSSTDDTASGSYQHKYYLAVGCYKPQTLTTYQSLTKATASDPTGYAQDPASLTVGRVYKLAFYHANTDDANVDIEFLT